MRTKIVLSETNQAALSLALRALNCIFEGRLRRQASTIYQRDRRSTDYEIRVQGTIAGRHGFKPFWAEVIFALWDENGKVSFFPKTLTQVIIFQDPPSTVGERKRTSLLLNYDQGMGYYAYDKPQTKLLEQFQKDFF